MGDYQTMAVNARMKVHVVLAAAGLEPDEADELVCAMEAGAVAGAHWRVEGLPGCAPDEQGTAGSLVADGESFPPRSTGCGWDGLLLRANRPRRIPVSAEITWGQLIALVAASRACGAQTTPEDPWASALHAGAASPAGEPPRSE